MSTIEDIDHLLKDLGAFVAGGQSEEMVSAAESKLGVSFPPSFREYLLKWGNVSCEGYEYYGLTPGQSHVEVSVWTKFCIVSILVKGGFCFPRDAWLLKEAIAK